MSGDDLQAAVLDASQTLNVAHALVKSTGVFARSRAQAPRGGIPGCQCARGDREARKECVVKAPKVHCLRCNGRGVRDLDYAHLETWKFLSRDWQPTTEIAKSLPNVAHTALCNRLASMERMGVITSRRSATNSKIREWRRL